MKKQPNQNGEVTSDKPTDALVNPPAKAKKQVSANKDKPPKSPAKDLQIRNVTR